MQKQVGFTTVPPASWLQPLYGTRCGSCSYLQVSQTVHYPAICLALRTPTFSSIVFQHQLLVPFQSTPYIFLDLYPILLYPCGPNALAPFEISISWGLKYKKVRRSLKLIRSLLIALDVCNIWDDGGTLSNHYLKELPNMGGLIKYIVLYVIRCAHYFIVFL